MDKRIYKPGKVKCHMEFTAFKPWLDLKCVVDIFYFAGEDGFRVIMRTVDVFLHCSFLYSFMYALQPV